MKVANICVISDFLKSILEKAVVDPIVPKGENKLWVNDLLVYLILVYYLYILGRKISPSEIKE